MPYWPLYYLPFLNPFLLSSLQSLFSIPFNLPFFNPSLSFFFKSLFYFLFSILFYLPFLNPFLSFFLESLSIFRIVSFVLFVVSCILLCFQYWCFYIIFLFHNWYRFNFSIYLSIFLKVLYLYLYDFIFYFYERLENKYKLLQF